MKTKYSVTYRKYSKDNKKLYMSFFRTVDKKGRKIKEYFARGFFDFEKEYFYVSESKKGTKEDLEGMSNILEELDMNEKIIFKTKA